MSTTTLSETKSVVLNASGNGVVTLRPDVGQYWTPLFVRVVTNTNTPPVAYCAVYLGAPGVPPQASQFIDDTFLGNGDTSSIIAGATVRPGEALIFSFQNGTANDVATATVFGMTSDIPPNLNLLPQVPGTHFAGKPVTSVLANIGSSVGSNIIAGGGFSNGQIVDVRQWASYYLTVSATTSTSPATGFNAIEIDLSWWSDSKAVNEVYADIAQIFADNIMGFPLSLGTLTMQDAMHGGFMQVNFINHGADSVSVQWKLIGTTRQVATPYVVQQNALDGVVLDTFATIPASGTFTQPIALYHGSVNILLNNAGANAMTVGLGGGSVGFGDFLASVPANTAQRVTVNLWKRAVTLAIQGTVGQQMAVRMITLFDKF